MSVPDTLYIYRADAFMGTLVLSDMADWTFTYDGAYLESHGQSLSFSLPLRKEPLCGPAVFTYFDGLLPEGSERELFANHLRTSVWNTEVLLLALCGECIGDIVILDERMHTQGHSQAPCGHTPLVEQELFSLLKPISPSRIPAEIKSRISLAGAQAKIALYHDDTKPLAEGWSLPYGTSATTHILKPQSLRFPALVENEAFCMRLARACGIASAEIALMRCEDSVLVATRFDRLRDDVGTVLRLPQEDICQIRGISPFYKYQAEGGPGFVDVHETILRLSAEVVTDTRRLLDIAIYNYLIGNCDAHGKNFALVTSQDGTVRLSLAYDLVSTTYYPGLTRNMAMSIGGCYAIDEVDGNCFLALGAKLGITGKLLGERIAAVAEGIAQNVEAVATDLEDSGFPAVAPVARHVLQEARVRSQGIR
jgi:serine/threonine-protein kinase HipA